MVGNESLLSVSSRGAVTLSSVCCIAGILLPGEKVMVGKGAMEEHTHRMGELFKQMTEL